MEIDELLNVPTFRLMFDTDLYIVTWNASSVMRRREELMNYLESRRVDICLISETKFALHRHFEPIPGYQCFSANFPNGSVRGGAAVFIKNNITHSQNSTVIEKKEFQMVSIKVTTRFGVISVAAIYCPPPAKIMLNDFSSIFTQLGDSFIIGGDWNAKHTLWGATGSQQPPRRRGEQLVRAIQLFGCTCMSSGEPSTKTYPEDCVDFFITKGIDPCLMEATMTKELLSVLSSNHNPIHLEIFPEPTIITKPTDLINEKTDWPKFKTILADCLPESVPILSVEGLEREYDRLVQLIVAAAEQSTPNIQTAMSSPCILQLLAEIRKLMAAVRRAKRAWSYSGSSSDEQIFIGLKRQLTEKQQKLRDQRLGEHLKICRQKTNAKFLWKAIKALERPIVTSYPLKNEKSLAKSSQEKAQVFSQFLSKMFSPLEIDQDLNEEDENIALEPKSSCPITVGEVSEIIKNHCEIGKDSGHDRITGKILMELPPQILEKLTVVFNAVMELQHIPSPWKLEDVTMTLEEDLPPDQISSYKETFFTPHFNELFERLYVKRLLPLIREQLHPEHLARFNQQHSNIEQICQIVSEIRRALSDKKVASAVFIDLTEACKKVWHKGLLRKLKKFLPSNHVKLLSSFFIGRNFRVRISDAQSEIMVLTAGIPKHSELGTILWLLYLTDVPISRDVLLATHGTSIAILATEQTVSGVNVKMQDSLDRLSEWAKQWKVALNDCAVHSVFGNKNANLAVELSGKKVPFSDNPTYLGMTLDTKLNWRPHVEKVLSELNCKLEKMVWLLASKSQLSTSEKVLLYKQILQPQWIFGCKLWSDTASNQDMVEKFQNKVLKMIVNKPKNSGMGPIRTQLQVNSVKEVIAELRKA